mmetsp:Transcript_92844/g.160868  ORF Transcript_92844/g.160868 Transcript_92844/m.160868 type:complete len:94 (+) Transcript_92844:171-452(+)
MSCTAWGWPNRLRTQTQPELEAPTQAALRALADQGGGAFALHCQNASPALAGGMYLSCLQTGGVVMMYLNKVDAANVLYRLGVAEPVADADPA